MTQSITIEQVNLLDLPSMPFRKKGKLPELACIYFVFCSQDSLLYIGRTVNLKNRWLHHHRYRDLVNYGTTRIAWMEVSIHELEGIERKMISHFNPVLNDKSYDAAQGEQEIKDIVDTLARHKREIDSMTKMLALVQENRRLRKENESLKNWMNSVIAVAKLAPSAQNSSHPESSLIASC